MARAKPTNRAEARRRHRLATAQATLDDTDGTPSDATAPPSSGASAARQRTATPAPSERPGITTAFRNAYRPLRLREDLVALPTLVRGRWFLIALALVAVGWIAPSVYLSSITVLIQSILALPVGGPTLPVFLVGFTATRGSYLLGLLLGLADIALGLVFAPLQNATVVPQDVLVQGVIYGLPTAVLFSAGAAWYRRFLAASSGRRQQQQRGSARGKGGGKPASRR